MSNHTPGPWRVHGPDDIRRIDPSDFLAEDWHGYAWVGAGGEPDGRFQSKVADLDRTDDASKEWRESALADARLIASAPDLLEALCMLVRCTVTVPGTHGLAIDNALAVIAKATGEQS